MNKPGLQKIRISLKYWLLLWGVFKAFTADSQTTGTDHSELQSVWEDLKFSERHHVGLTIYDLEQEETMFDYHADNYFTPASNIKLLTMYAALQCLEDTIDAGWYKVSGDSLMIWGGGDPGTFYPDIEAPSYMVSLISQNPGFIFFSDQNFQTTRFGKGWAWDDHPYTYQCERNSFPIFGNRLWIQRTEDTISVIPSFLTSLINIKRDSFTDTGKSEWGDGYFYTYDTTRLKEEEEIPITFFKNDLKYCWAEATGRQINFVNFPLAEDAIPIKGSLRDTLIREMMFESDNFIAEQLLLACSQKLFDQMNEELVIDSILGGSLSALRDEIAWVDGSGLSRYNLATPRSLVDVLRRMTQEKGLSYMMKILPAGGRSGTLVTGFKEKRDRPYLFAKSGSLRHIYCLSGLLITKSGKILLFSWMNTDYHVKTAEIKRSMDKFFSFLYDHY